MIAESNSFGVRRNVNFLGYINVKRRSLLNNGFFNVFITELNHAIVLAYINTFVEEFDERCFPCGPGQCYTLEPKPNYSF
jgi:hypothetical protein